MQMQPIVMTPPRRANLVGLRLSTPAFEARRRSKASRTRAYNDRVGILHPAPWTPVGRPFGLKLRRFGFADNPAP